VTVPARNRVGPDGQIHASPLRGAWTGNRGCLHRGRDIVRSHRGNLWITCRLQFKDRWNEQWQPNHYTFLYFYDEAVALAAGHRPCGECRHASYQAYRAAWSLALDVPAPSAGEMNRQLHAERLAFGTNRRRLHRRSWTALPDGVFVAAASGPQLVYGDAVIPWSAHHGYGPASARPRSGTVAMLTPPSTAATLHAGYRPQVDRSVL
jgi:hypothetical protein